MKVKVEITEILQKQIEVEVDSIEDAILLICTIIEDEFCTLHEEI